MYKYYNNVFLILEMFETVCHCDTYVQTSSVVKVFKFVR